MLDGYSTCGESNSNLRPPVYQKFGDAWRNDSKEWCPGFGLIYLDYNDGDNFFTTDLRDGQVVWKGKKPNKEAATYQDPARHRINGPEPVGPGMYGRCTTVFPSQALHDCPNDRLENFSTCGPKDDSWYIWSTGYAFTIISHDACKAIDTKDHVRTIWITPNLSQPKPAYMFGQGSGPASANRNIPFNGIYLQDGGDSWDTIPNTTATGWIAKKPGIYVVTISTTIQCTEVSSLQGDILGFELYQKDADDDDEKTTNIKASRKQLVYLKPGALNLYDGVTSNAFTIISGSEVYTAENICASGIVKVTKDKTKFFIRNIYGKDVQTSDTRVEMHSIGPYIKQGNGNLNYEKNAPSSA